MSPDGLIVHTYQHGKGDLAGTGDVATISVGARKPLLPIVSSLLQPNGRTAARHRSTQLLIGTSESARVRAA